MKPPAPRRWPAPAISVMVRKFGSGTPSIEALVPKPPMNTVSNPACSTMSAVNTSCAPRLRMMPGWESSWRMRCGPLKDFMPFLVIFLQRFHTIAALLEGGDAEGGSFGAAEGRHDGSPRINGRRADFHLVRARALAGRGVDDELDFPILEQVHRVGPAFGELEDALHFQPGFFQDRGCARSGRQFKTQLGKEPGDARHFLFVGIAHADEYAATHRQWPACRHLGFGVGRAQIGVQPHDFTRGTHFRREQNVLAM